MSTSDVLCVALAFCGQVYSRYLRGETLDRRLAVAYFAPSRMQRVSFFASASLTCFFVGIGVSPHLPVPPFQMLCTSAAAALASPAYLAAISRRAGPTSLVAAAWQPR